MVVTNENYLKNNPIGETDTVIIVPAYDGQLMFLKYVLKQYKKTGKYVICSYDRHTEIPPIDILDIPDAWVWKHKTYGAEKRLGWLWDVVYAAGIAESFQNIDHIVTGNGDCAWDKPDGIQQLIDQKGEFDILSASSDSTIHTCNVIWSRPCFLSFVEHIKHKLMKNKPEGYSPEVLLRDFITEESMFRHMPTPKNPMYPEKHFYGGRVDHYSSYYQDSTFKEVVGYRNLGGEFKTICQEHLKPLSREYFDLRENGKFLTKHEQDTIYKYYTTGDYRWLYMYYDQGEDSFFNRRYFPLEYYGDEPLEDDSKRK